MSERTHSKSDSTDDEHPAATPESEEAYAKRAQSYQRAPEDFKSDVDAEDLKVPDYPVIVEPEGYGEASAYLASWGMVEDMQAGQNQQGVTMNARRVAKILRDHYVSPNFENLDADGVRNMHMDAPDKFLGAIMPGMDAEMNSDGSATVTQADSGK